MGGNFHFAPSGTVERMRTHFLCPSENPHALKRENVYLFSAMHLPDFQVWARQSSPHVPHICWESEKLIAIFGKWSPLLSRWQRAAALTSRQERLPSRAFGCSWSLWRSGHQLSCLRLCNARAAKQSVSANRDGAVGRIWQGREKGRPSASQRWAPASSLPNRERCPLHGLWTHWVYLCCLLKGTLCRLTWADVPVSADGEAGSTASGEVGGFPAVLYLQALEAWYPSAGTQTGCLWTAYSLCTSSVLCLRSSCARGEPVWARTPCSPLHLAAAAKGLGGKPQSYSPQGGEWGRSSLADWWLWFPAAAGSDAVSLCIRLVGFRLSSQWGDARAQLHRNDFHNYGTAEYIYK